jgi:hypothetical protein
MRDDQTKKLNRYRRKLEDDRAKKRDEVYLRATQSLSYGLSALSDAISDLSQKEAPEAQQIDLTPLVEKISNIKVEPIINVAAPNVNVEAPIVRVEVDPTDDIYARYKRSNSVNGPEGMYHGFVDNDSNWFIQLESTGVDGTARSRYATGKGSFGQSWQKRRGLTYKPFDQVTIA